MKKGVLFTLGIMYLGFILLALSYMYMEQTKTSLDGTYEVIALQREIELHNSLQKDISEIFTNTSQITIEKSISTVSFSENFKNSGARALNETLSDYQRFLQVSEYLNQGGLTAELNLEEVKNHSLIVVHPYGLTYTHPVAGGDEIKLIPENYSYISKYDVGFDVSPKMIQNCIVDSVPPGANDNITVKVDIQGGGGSSCMEEEKFYANGENKIFMNTSEGYNFTLTLNQG
ncbi:MAG: hypothetical protein ABH950_08130, partial [Candidatus Altiarchaeota archaeon]